MVVGWGKAVVKCVVCSIMTSPAGQQHMSQTNHFLLMFYDKDQLIENYSSFLLNKCTKTLS